MGWDGSVPVPKVKDSGCSPPLQGVASRRQSWARLGCLGVTIRYAEFRARPMSTHALVWQAHSPATARRALELAPHWDIPCSKGRVPNLRRGGMRTPEPTATPVRGEALSGCAAEVTQEPTTPRRDGSLFAAEPANSPARGGSRPRPLPHARQQRGTATASSAAGRRTAEFGERCGPIGLLLLAHIGSQD